MNYHRLLLLLEPGVVVDGGVVDGVVDRGVAGLRLPSMRIEHLLVARLQRSGSLTLTIDAPSSTTAPTTVLGGDALVSLCVAEGIDLVVDGARTLRSVAALYALRRLHRLPILFASDVHQPQRLAGDGLQRVRCLAMGARARDQVHAFLRDHADPSMRISLVGPGAPSHAQLVDLLELGGIQASVEVPTRHSPGQRLSRPWLRDDDTALLVCAQLPALVLLGARRTTAVLLLPPPTPRSGADAVGLEGELDVADVADLGGPLRTRLETIATVRSPHPVPDQTIAVVADGHCIARIQLQDGALTLPTLSMAPSLRTTHTIGLFRVVDGAHDDHDDEHDDEHDDVVAVERHIAIVRPGNRPLLLCDADVVDATLQLLPHLEPLVVRLRPVKSLRAIRERLRALSLPAHVLDARAVLDEGDAVDVSEALDAVRLARVAVRLREAGFPIVALVHRGPLSPTAPDGMVCFQEAALLACAPDVPALQPQPPSLRRVDQGAMAGNLVQLEIDNQTARRWLMEAIASSTTTLHLQTYLVADDAVGRAVEAALAAAAARGVVVRVLVDALHALHGTLGATNALLGRLAMVAGVEVRSARPIRELPSMTDLKLRDHRKVVVVDGGLALVGGRNLADEYYTGYDEVDLDAASVWTRVPWFDAGARLQGPAVAGVAASFREAWLEAGGDDFDVVTPDPIGSSSVRVVTHRGLRDAHALEAYRELIAQARSHLLVVNGFPLLLELQHALLDAQRRGVAVQVLAGHLVTTHDGTAFPGSFVAGRVLATDLVFSRLDPLVAMGADVRCFMVAPSMSTTARLGPLRPQMHAKLLSVDGKRCAIGSANLDITASYWESELMLVVDDHDVVADLEARLQRVMQQATASNRDDPVWAELARRRAWMRRWPGVLAP